MHKVVLILSLIFAFWLVKSPSCFAFTPSWNLVYPSINESTSISSAPLNPSVVYASIRKWTETDILKSVDFGKTWLSVKNNLPNGNADIDWISVYQKSSDFLAISVWGSTGGIYLSENGGISWTRIYTSTTPRSVAIDPVDSNIIFAGIGGNNDSNSGVYKTIDKGLHWQKISQLGSKNNAQISINPENPNFILADSDPNFYRSTDGGLNWSLLPISNTYSTGSVFDNKNGIIYTGKYTGSIGVYSSSDYGNSWTPKNDGFDGYPFHISQNINGDLFVTNGIGAVGKVWKSTDNGNSWNNIGNNDWLSKSTWGLDVSNNRILVSVEGLGIYYADLEPDPVVFVPGFATTWSSKGLIENQSTTYADWKLMPVFTDAYYQPLLSTLKNSGLTENQNLFTFGYDFRKSIVDNANSLNTFLTDKTPGKKANIVAHSMGGLVARYCFEKVTGCAGKIGKIVTAGTPHQGLIEAYQLWEGGQFDADPALKFMEEIMLHATNLPYLTNKDIVQNRIPGIKDLLPTFDYISGKPYSNLSSQAKNPVLKSLQPFGANFISQTTPLSGNSQDTYSGFTTIGLSSLDKALGLWFDGKPNVFSTATGDGTVLKSSSEISGSLLNKNYALKHEDYLRTTQSLTDITATLGLTPTSIVTGSDTVNSVLAFIIHSPATISVNGDTGIDGKAVFIKNPTSQNYQVVLTGTATGSFQLDSVFSDQNHLVKKTLTNTISANEVKTYNFNFVPNSDQNFIDTNNNIFVTSFNSGIASSKNRTVKSIGARVNAAVTDIIANRNRTNNFSFLEKAYIDLVTVLKTENQPLERKNIEDFVNLLLTIATDLNKKYGKVTTQTTAVNEKSRALSSINAKANKASLIVRDAANLLLAQTMQKTAEDLITVGSYYQAVLLFQGIGYLLN